MQLFYSLMNVKREQNDRSYSLDIIIGKFVYEYGQ